ncbi:MAG TPA: hypothetical protein PKD51_09235 [Saprospiraceae bacterium]|nr:hypothetical protein [Saprospiraceae bacterium]HMU03666.1 hypothetical protein [Saprospiraceae bacterium]
MICIVSKLNDVSVESISFWLKKFNENVVVISDFSMLLKFFELNEVNIKLLFVRNHNTTDKAMSNEIELYKMQMQELESFDEYICYLVNTSKCKLVGNIKKESHNKLIQSNLAKSIGLSTPDFSINYKHVENVSINYKNIITKPFSKGLVIFRKNEYYISYTTRINESINFHTGEFPSLIQEEIEKEFEVRMFIFGSLVYSLGILSQESENTKVDVRNYDFDNPNYVFPIKMPNEIVSKCKKLLRKMNLMTGSFDFIKSKKDGKYYFLEVNPNGEFDLFNFYLGDQIYKNVALELIKYIKK